MDIHDRQDDANQAYFRESREARFGKRLEEVAAARDAGLAGFRASLEPLRSMLGYQPFIGGASPLYCRLHRVRRLPVGARHVALPDARRRRSGGRLVRALPRPAWRARRAPCRPPLSLPEAATLPPLAMGRPLCIGSATSHRPHFSTRTRHGDRTHLFDDQAGRDPAQPDRRHHQDAGRCRPARRRLAARLDEPPRSRRLLCRPPRAPVLRRAGRVRCRQARPSCRFSKARTPS